MPDTTDDSGTISETTSFDREGRTVPEARRNESDGTPNGTVSSPDTAAQSSHQQQTSEASTAHSSPQTTDIDRVISAGRTASEPLIEAATRIRTDSLSGVTARLILLTYIGVGIVTGGTVAMFVRTAMFNGGVGVPPTGNVVAMTGAVVFPTAGLLLTGVLAYAIVLTYDTDTVKTVLLSGSIACVVGHSLFLGVVFALLSLLVPGVGGPAVDLVGYTTAIVVSGLLAGVFFTTISYVGASVLQL